MGDLIGKSKGISLSPDTRNVRAGGESLCTLVRFPDEFIILVPVVILLLW